MKYLILLFSTLLFASCGDDSKEAATQDDKTPSEAGGTEVVIETSMGTIRARLHEDTAPITTKNFLKYVEQKHYDGTIFHRVISNFMIQGGGFEMNNQVAKEKPTGDGIKNESPKTKSNTRGTLAMARTTNPDSATAQFFINVVNNDKTGKVANLDYPESAGHGYAVFGEVIEGMDVVDKIKEVETHTTSTLSLEPDNRYRVTQFDDVPVEPVFIKSIRLASDSE